MARTGVVITYTVCSMVCTTAHGGAEFVLFSLPPPMSDEMNLCCCDADTTRRKLTHGCRACRHSADAALGASPHYVSYVALIRGCADSQVTMIA